MCHNVCSSYEGNPAENVVQAYLFVMLAHKGGSVAILSDNGTDFKNKVLNKVCDQLGIKMLLSSPFYPQGNGKVENIHNFLKETLTKILTTAFLRWMNSFHLLAIVVTYFQASLFFLMFGCNPAEGHLSHLNNSNKYYDTNEGKIVLEELYKLWKHHANHLNGIHQRNEHMNNQSSNNNPKFKIGQAVIVKNHALHTLEPKYLLDYRVQSTTILSDSTLLLVAPIRKIKENKY